jgi:hypothetical protein
MQVRRKNPDPRFMNMNFRSLLMVAALLGTTSLVACADGDEQLGGPDTGGTDGGSDAAGDTSTDGGIDPDTDSPDAGDTSGPDVEGPDAGDTSEPDVEDPDAGDDTTEPVDVTDAGDDTTDPGDVTDAGDDTTDPGDVTDPGDTTSIADTTGDTGGGDTTGDTGGTVACTAYTAVATLEPGTPYTGVLADGPSDAASSCGFSGSAGEGPEDVFAAELDAGTWCVDTFGSSFDTVLHVRSRCEDATTELACNDDFSSDSSVRASRMDVTLTTATTVWLFLDGFDEGVGGDYRVVIRPGPCVLDEILCSDGSYVSGDYCDAVRSCGESEEVAACTVFCFDTFESTPGIGCDGVADCGDASDEEGCPFTCTDGTDTYFDFDICDGDDACTDGTDEADCPEFVCGDGGVIVEGQVCDGDIDCVDATDELNCLDRFVCADLSASYPVSYQCDGFNDCTDASDEDACPVFTCVDGTEIPLDDQCNGFAECADFSDEVGCEESFFCADDSGVIPTRWICDGDNDCDDASDEVECPVFTCGDGEEIPLDFVCDGGFPDCLDGSDEADCP